MKKVKIYLILFLFIGILSSSFLDQGFRNQNHDYPPNFVVNWRRADNQPIPSKLIAHVPQTIMLHHTGSGATDKSLIVKLRRLYKFSTKEKQWGDLPYHFYVDRTGLIGVGRSLNFAPDTNTKFNTSGYLNIVLEGDFSIPRGEQPSVQQRNSLRALLEFIEKRYGLTELVLHRHKAKTKCPGNLSL